MASAVSAGAISDVICNPMFVVRTRLQTEAVHASLSMSNNNTSTTSHRPHSVLSMRQTIAILYKEGGIASFWRGMTANLLGLSHVAIQFPAYEYFKHQLLLQKSSHHHSPFTEYTQEQQQQHHHHHHNTAFDLLVASAASKMIASVITYPHEVIRSRMMDARTVITTPTTNTIQQQQQSSIHPKRLGFIATCVNIYKQEGIIGYYSGLPVSLIRVIPNTCLTFITYELFLRYSREHIFV
jgi:solute carrier family 25 (mitochondrial folate transporter), member 32